MEDYQFQTLTTNGQINRGIVDKVIKDYEMMSSPWKEVMTQNNSPQYQEYVQAKKLAHTMQRPTLIFKALIVVLFVVYYHRLKNPPQQPSLSAVGGDPVDDLEINNHKHDGTQPELESAFPGQKPSVAWNN